MTRAEDNDAEQLSAIVGCMPWPAALLNRSGTIVRTNVRWKTFESAAGLLMGPRFAEGRHYVAECRALRGSAEDAPCTVTIAIERVLSGATPETEVAYSTAVGDFRLRITVTTAGAGTFALVCHLPSSGNAQSLEALVDARTTQLATATERLRQAQRLQLGILDSIPDIAWLKDADGRFLAVNRPFGEACGQRPAELIGKTDLDLWARELAERYQADDREVMSSRQLKRVEEPLVDSRGEQAWVETVKVPIMSDEGDVIGTAGIARDITHRKNAETLMRRSHADLERLVQDRTEALRAANEALRADIAARERVEEQQRRLVAILEATTDFVGIADVARRWTYVNRAGRRMVGLRPDTDLSALTIADFHPEWAARMLLEAGVPTALREGVWSGETALLTRDGREVPVSQLVLVHRDSAGEPEFVSTIARDVSERKMLEAQLLQSQKMEAIGRLAGGVAHDFNNLLTVILGYCELTLSNSSNRSVQFDNVRLIQGAADRAAALTGQLLAFARKQIVEARVIDINRQILDLDGMLRRLIGADVELVTVACSGAASVKCDPSQLQQILINLAVNARDAMPHGGKLTIHTSNVDVKDGACTSHRGVPAGEYVLLAVSDTGAGMAADVLAHVFEPFFTTKGSGKGTGLGLATCYGIVQQAGGYIAVESTVGRGTLFRIYFPRAAGEVPVVDDPPAESAVADGFETVLLVEDEPAVRGIAERALREHGFHVLVAERGSEAIQIAETFDGTIHLLLTDVVMPQMSGKQVAERVRSIRADVRVLFMSGYDDAVVVQQGTVQEGLAFVAKPFTPQSLVKRVREAMDGARKRDSDAPHVTPTVSR